MRGRLLRRQDGYSQKCMAKVILKDLKKVYPNTEKKKKVKKGEEPQEKKSNLQITDEGVVAVQQFSLEIADKEFIVLVGPSGCGKSTTLRMIAGLEDITSGELWIGDKLMNDVEPKDRDIAMVFQNYALYPHMTVYENMAFSLKLKKVPKDEIDRKVRQAAEILDITQYLDRKPKALSGGQRQRVAIGRAIVRDPAVFLMDEPLSNLDAKLRESMRDELRALQQRLGITSLYVTHDQSEAMAISDKVVIMKDGVICQQGTPQEIYEQPASRFVANFIGKANFIDGIFKGRDGEAALVEIGGKTFSIPAPGKMEGVEVGGACCLTVRPESFLLTKDAGALPGTVSRATYYGAKIEYEVMLNEQPIIVEVYNPQLTERFSVGDAVTMSLIEGCVRVLK